MGGHAVGVASSRAGWFASVSIRWQDLPEYRVPVLHRVSKPSIVWQLLCLLDVVAALLLAVAIRQGWTDVILMVQRFWLAGGIAWCAAGAWWSVVRTRNIHLLEGRVPTVGRSVRAWVWPPAWTLLATFTIVQLDPTEPVDIRPAIVVVVFALCAWRPFSLLRRIFTSLSRLRFDELVVSLGAIQILTWLVLWWHAVEIDADDTTSNAARAFQGVAAAAALAFAACVVLVRSIDRAATRAQQHRVLALQTREEHRYVRSLGLNPFKSHVFDEIVRAKLTRERHRREETDDDDPNAQLAPTPGAISRSLVAARSHPRWQRISPAFDRLRHTRRKAAVRLTTMSDAVEKRTTRAARSSESDPATAASTGPTPHPRSSAGDAGHIVPIVEAEPPARPTTDEPPATPAVTDYPLSDPDRTRPPVVRSALDVRAAVEPAAVEPAAVEPGAVEPGVDDLPRLPDRRRREPAPSGADTPTDDAVDGVPSEATAGRAGVTEPVPVEPTASRVPDHDSVDAGVAAGDARDDDTGVDVVVDDDDEQTGDEEDSVPRPRLVALESARLILLAGLVALALSFDWGVIIALDLREPIRGGAISVQDLLRLDRGRNIVNIVLALTLPLQAVWARLASTWARRAGCTTARPRLCGWLATVSLLSGTTALLGIVSEASPGAVAALLLLATTSAWLSIMSTTRLAVWADSSPTNCRIWATGQLLVTLVHIAIGGTDAVDAQTAIEWLAFLGVALGLVTAVSAVVAGVLALDIEDSIRASRRAARWVQGDRHPDAVHALAEPVETARTDHVVESADAETEPVVAPDVAEPVEVGHVVDDDRVEAAARPEPVAGNRRALGRLVASPRLPRFVMGFSLLLLTFSSLWVTLEAVVLAPPVEDGILVASDVTQIGRARDWASGVLAVTLPLQVLWVVVASARGRLGRSGGNRHDRLFFLLIATVGLAVVDLLLQFVVDLPSAVRQGVLAVAFATTWAAVRVLGAALDRNHRHVPLVRGWAGGLVVLAVLSVIAAADDVTSTTSADGLAWMWSAHTAVAAVVTFTAILGSSELVDATDTVDGAEPQPAVPAEFDEPAAT